ncbi:MAG: 2-oxoglutarate oxidoreductase [Deferribacteres bacterium]|nr:2-oxoglutarate oxidoreductase [candidate division KSB1 bacterium]MCB9502754.1 2-oxoglutarate oxidoreductase [Deferribacteres bacterium]
MFGINQNCEIALPDTYYTLEDYQSNVPRWCPGCGDNSILTSVQRLCRDEQLPPEKTVFVSGIGCSSRFPHYMGTYGFHGLHGRALPIAQGVKIRRPDLDVFVNMGDGDCCSIGTAHWIHAVRYNMNLVALLHDNEIYGLTKMQVSPTSPQGLVTNTTPRGAFLKPIKPLSVTLGISNVSFVAQVAEWMPELMYDVLKMAYHHKGFSFVRVVQRCPHFTPHVFDNILSPDAALLLQHDDGLRSSDTMLKIYKSQEEHDPSNLNRARELAEREDCLPVGILYRNENVEVYDETRRRKRAVTHEMRKAALEKEFSKFLVEPVTGGNGHA